MILLALVVAGAAVAVPSRAAVQTATSTATPVLSLDPTGLTIPDTNYAVPAGAVFMSVSGHDNAPGTRTSPVSSLNRAISLAPAGGTIVVSGGTYRDWYHNAAGNVAFLTKALTLQAAAHQQVWFDGTDVEPSPQWTADGAGHWSMNWSTPTFCNGGYYTLPMNAQSPANTGPCAHYDMSRDPSNPLANDPQMVFVDGTYAHQATTLAAATGGAFFYDWSARRLHISTNPAGHTIEVASRPVAVVSSVSGVRILGLGFRRYATNEYSNTTDAAVYLGKGGATIENSVFRQMAGQAVSVAPQGARVQSSVFAFNGFNGLGSNGHSSTAGKPADGLVFEGNVVNGNNTELFGTGCTLSCAQSGVKIAHMDGFTAQNNILENNHGNGFWCDEDCTNGVMINNIARGNTSSGLDYEVSSLGIIASNLVYNNGYGGIISSSATTKIYNNTLINNAAIDIWIYDDGRNANNLRGSQVGPDTNNVDVTNNILSGGNITTFKASRSDSVGSNTGPNGFFSGLDYNSYYRSGGPGKSLINWVDTSNAANYRALSAFHSAHGWESHGQDVSSGPDPFFVNQAAGDFAVRPGSAAYHSATQLPADVAGVLGISPAAGRSRGAITWPGSGGVHPPPTATATATSTPRPTAPPTSRPSPTPTSVPTPSPTPPPPAAVVIRAESLATSGAVIGDARATGGTALALWAAGSASGTVTTPSVDTVTVRARGSTCQGAPVMTVSVDGSLVSTRTVTAQAWTDFIVQAPLTAGRHRIDIAFINDRYLVGVCDRNLFLDTITLRG